MMKYILFKSPEGKAIPVVFPALVKHSDMAGTMPDLTPVAAGFVRVGIGEDCTPVLKPYGSNMSLSLGTTLAAIEAFDQMNSEIY